MSVCLFLGTAFTALEDPPISIDKEKELGLADHSPSRLRRESFLGMIETRIGLPRFNDLLKKPLSSDRGGRRGTFTDFFFTQGFKVISDANITSMRVILACTTSVHRCVSYSFSTYIISSMYHRHYSFAFSLGILQGRGRGSQREHVQSLFWCRS